MPVWVPPFPDTVAMVINYLRTELDVLGPAVVVQSEVPSPRPPTFVLVTKTGGQRITQFSDGPQLTVAAWAPSEEAASDLVELCRALIFDLRGRVKDDVIIYWARELADPAPLQDISDHPRWTFTVQLHVRNDPAAA